MAKLAACLYVFTRIHWHVCNNWSVDHNQSCEDMKWERRGRCNSYRDAFESIKSVSFFVFKEASIINEKILDTGLLANWGNIAMYVGFLPCIYLVKQSLRSGRPTRLQGAPYSLFDQLLYMLHYDRNYFLIIYYHSLLSLVKYVYFLIIYRYGKEYWTTCLC